MNRSMLMVAMFADYYIGKSAKSAKYSHKDGVSTFVINFVPYIIDENPVDRQELTSDERHFIDVLARKRKAAIYFCDIRKNFRGGTLDDSIYPPVWVPKYCGHDESFDYLHDSHEWDNNVNKALYKTSDGFKYHNPYGREENKQLASALTSSVTFFFRDEFSQAQLDELAEFLGVKAEVGC